jgi:hypothetical protein
MKVSNIKSNLGRNFIVPIIIIQFILTKYSSNYATLKFWMRKTLSVWAIRPLKQLALYEGPVHLPAPFPPSLPLSSVF